MSSDQFKLNLQKTEVKGLAEPRFLLFPDYKGDKLANILVSVAF